MYGELNNEHCTDQYKLRHLVSLNTDLYLQLFILIHIYFPQFYKQNYVQ